jgi:ATP-dependent DNA helicase RecG
MIKDFDVILSEGESYTIEFKESADKSIASEVCAFANASGGRIFIGVSDSGKVTGTDTSNAARSRLQDTINKIEPHLSVDISVHDNIMVVTVPEGVNKPYSCSQGFYLRSGPNSQKLDRDSIIEFLQAEGKAIYDSIVNEKYPITDSFNEAEYQKYLKKSDISDVLPRESVLRNLGCADSANNGRLSYTNAGLLFFRDNSSNLYFDFTHVVCALYKGVDKFDIIDAKNLNGGIMENIDNAIVFLKRNLRVRYEIKTVQRKNILELPEDALREAVTNAVCHRDYFEKGARVMVEIYDDRVEITNPGSTPKGITKENFGNTSVARNPIIASLLYRAHYIERMGTGIKRMTNAMETAGLEKPIFQTEGHFFKVIFKRDLLYHDKNDIANVVKDVVKENEAKILGLIAQDNKTTTSKMAHELNISERQVQRVLKKLTDNGIISRIGGRKNGYWHITLKE